MNQTRKFSRIDFETELKTKSSIREMFQYCIDTIPARYLDIHIAPFFRGIAVSGIMKFLQMLNINFHD